MITLILTGSRTWHDHERVRRAMTAIGHSLGIHPQDVTVRHGKARGLDTVADHAAREFGCTVEEYPARWGALGRAAGAIRNREMAGALPQADLCLAFPVGESPGTRDCMAACEGMGIPVIDCTDDDYVQQINAWALRRQTGDLT